jgi:hypothetical protein
VAQTYASYNKVDGAAGTLNANTDIQFGTWSAANAQFSPYSGTLLSSSSAVQITLWRDTANNNAIPTVFAKILGVSTSQVHAVAVATYTAAVNDTQTIEATGNPFLAGMPPGSVASLNNPANSPDYAGTASNPLESPQLINIPLTNGESLTFSSISGNAAHDPNLSQYGPDGDTANVGSNTDGSENGIANANIPIDAVVGVFLTDSQPNLSAAPATLDFSTDSSRNFTTLAPQLKQIFFIGDGLTDSGQTQTFVVPNGATRLYLATWDFYQWNNNIGSRTMAVNQPAKIALVK